MQTKPVSKTVAKLGGDICLAVTTDKEEYKRLIAERKGEVVCKKI